MSSKETHPAPLPEIAPTQNVDVTQLAADLSRSWFPAPSKRGIGRFVLGAIGATVGAGIALNLSPYNTTVAGIPTEVRMTTLTQPGMSAEIAKNSLNFPRVDGLPIGLHANMGLDVPTIVRASSDPDKYGDELKASLQSKIGPVERHFAGVAAIGGLAGGLTGVGAAEGLMVAFSKRRRKELYEADTVDIRHIGRFVGASGAIATVTLAAFGGVGASTFNHDWQSDSYVHSSLLSLADKLPSQMAQVDELDRAAAGRVNTIVDLQGALQHALLKPEEEKIPATAFNVLYISDMHNRDLYPDILKYIQNPANNIKMVINTGDEATFSKTFEFTEQYGEDLEKVARLVPFVFIRGNHDSQQVADWMRERGVIVLDGDEDLGGQIVNIYGLNIAGTGDPRQYADEDSPISGSPEWNQQKTFVTQQLKTLNPQTHIDIYMTHEPPAAQQVAKLLGGRVTQVAFGHVHVFNPATAIQKKGQPLMIQNGTTGLGGKFDYSREKVDVSSIEVGSFAGSCEMTKLVRVTSNDPSLPNPASSPFGVSNNVETLYLQPQEEAPGRVCDTSEPVGTPESWGDPMIPPNSNLQADGKLKAPVMVPSPAGR